MERLNQAHGLMVPAAHWSNLSQLWMWLPPHTRHAALNSLGTGAGLTRVVEAVEAAHPDLRDRFRAHLAESLEEDLDDPNGDGKDYLVEQVWPAVIAYVVTLATQEQQRPGHRPPWHVLSDSFEPGTPAGHFEEIGSSLDADGLGVGFTLDVGVGIVAEALGFNTNR